MLVESIGGHAVARLLSGSHQLPFPIVTLSVAFAVLASYSGLAAYIYN